MAADFFDFMMVVGKHSSGQVAYPSLFLLFGPFSLDDSIASLKKTVASTEPRNACATHKKENTAQTDVEVPNVLQKAIGRTWSN